jgi:murein DD-endopeptidase MepM/ murein hydrolase activator NlpD
MHDGVDIAAPSGTPIHAAADGQVISTSYMRGYGNVVILDHGGGVSTVYAHASRIYCTAGQQVHRGDVIAAVGATGLATGPHCHFEVRIGGHAVNPMGRF